MTWPGRHSLLALAAVLLSSAAATGQDHSNVIRFKTYTRNDHGLVRCGIFSEKGWLKQPIQSTSAEIHGRVAVCSFSNLPDGVYAISGFHDENKNGKLDTNFIGYPTEEYCASRNARRAFSAPSFSDAKFGYRGGPLDVEARMK